VACIFLLFSTIAYLLAIKIKGAGERDRDKKKQKTLNSGNKKK
jgi:hypothetical protein